MKNIEELPKRKKAGMNGFGRFGLHLLKYWLDRAKEAHFTLAYINDDFHSIENAYRRIIGDKAVFFSKYRVEIEGSSIVFFAADGSRYAVEYTSSSKSDIPWKGEPDIMFECSGKYQVASECREYLEGNTKLVVISATSWDAEKTLVYGFNHSEFNSSLQIISYGSCTVNAYVPFANYINEKYEIKDSDVNVIHNIQDYKLPDYYTLNRKFCTLEKSGPLLLNFLNKDNFTVNYTVIPYNGVSTIDLRFRLKNVPARESFIDDLHHAFTEGSLQDIYSMDEKDVGPEIYNCTTYSSVFIKEGIKIIGDTIYLFSYFDNENSVNRYYDLVEYISSK